MDKATNPQFGCHGLPTCGGKISITEDRGAVKAFSHIYAVETNMKIFMTIPYAVNGGRAF